MVQIIVMSVFCIVLMVYGYGVVFKKAWLQNLLSRSKIKHDEQTSVNQMRNVMGYAALLFGSLGLIINVITAFVLMRGSAI